MGEPYSEIPVVSFPGCFLSLLFSMHLSGQLDLAVTVNTVADGYGVCLLVPAVHFAGKLDQAKTAFSFALAVGLRGRQLNPAMTVFAYPVMAMTVFALPVIFELEMTALAFQACLCVLMMTAFPLAVAASASCRAFVWVAVLGR